MAHLTESEFARVADDSLEPEPRAAIDAHLATCDDCRATVETQALARRVLIARPITPVRDLSAAVRATLEAERPWIERLNWRRLSLRMAPVAAAVTIGALILVITTDSATGNSPTAATSTVATEAARATDHKVVSALWSGEVNDDQLFALFLSARPDESLATYVQEK